MAVKSRLAILISGRGSNMAALLDAAAQPHYPAEVVLVLSNAAEAPGLALAEKAGIPTAVIDHRPFGKGEEGRAAFDLAVDRRLRGAGADLVCLAGFMRMLSAGFVSAWDGRMLNIHPSLLPGFKGLDVHRRMIDAGVRIAGCTVHFVTAEMDAGPIVGQAAVPVEPGDDADALAARILAAEHALYPACVAKVASGAARLENGRVVHAGSTRHGDLIVSV